MRQFNTDAKVLAEVMLNIYGENESDVLSLNQKINGHTVFDALAEAYKYSYIGTTVDFSRAIEPWEQAFAKLNIPISIIRGAGDGAVSEKVLARLYEITSTITVSEVVGSGHFITSNPADAAQAWQLIRDALLD